MRAVPARVLLSAIALGAFTAGALFRNWGFFLLGLGPAVLLATSLLTSRRPLTRALQQFQNRAVEVRLWGALPPGVSGALVLTEVNTLGAGVHLFFSVEGGADMHLKIAQPRNPTLEFASVRIQAARYVQWNGYKIRGVDGTQAVSIAAAPAR